MSVFYVRIVLCYACNMAQDDPFTDISEYRW